MATTLMTRPATRPRSSTVTAYRAVLRQVIAAVRHDGAAAALAELRRDRPAFTEFGYHDTAAVYLVWAADRLIAAGFDDVRVLWHPLVQLRSMRQWWDDDTLASAAARHEFVAATRWTVGDPVPAEPQPQIAA